MRKHTIISYSVTAIVLSFLFSLTGCKKSIYLYLNTPTSNKTFFENKNGVEIQLTLSDNSLIDNKLKVVNNTKEAVMISNRGIVLEIPETGVRVYAAPNYNRYLNIRKFNVTKACQASAFPYACSDQVNSFYTGLVNKGFRFKAIPPGGTSEGFIAFNIPFPLSDSKNAKAIGKLSSKIKGPVNSAVSITVRTPKSSQKASFPVVINVYDDIKEVPYKVAHYFH